MQFRKWTIRAGVILLLIVFAGAMIPLGRFGGSSYPAYSSLRSDPKGTKLLYEALEKTGRVQVTRSYLPIEELTGQDAVILYLGVDPASLLTVDGDYLTALENAAKAGDRIVLGVSDVSLKLKHPAAIERRWNVSLSKPVAVEKNFGPGSIVFLPHTEKFTNASLIKHADSRKLISSLIGDKQKVVFEESHLGVVESGSVAALIRRYRLQGLVAGLLALSALFAWNRSVSFPPPSRYEDQAGSRIAGGDSRDILTGLLSRHMGSQSLMAVCVSEWNRLHPDRNVSLQPNEDAGTAYRRIQNEVHKKRTGSGYAP